MDSYGKVNGALRGRKNRGLVQVLSFKVTEDLHDAILEYVSKQEGADHVEISHKGIPYGGSGIAHHLRILLAKELQKELGREILIYDYEAF